MLRGNLEVISLSAILKVKFCIYTETQEYIDG